MTETQQLKLPEIVCWLNDNDLEKIYSSSYWNNIEEEKKKEWWIEDGNYERCLTYLKSSRLLSEYEFSEKFISETRKENLVVADLAAGTGWISALISRLNNVREVRSVEISKHRLETLFEHSVRMLSGEPGKICRFLGSFYDLKFDTHSIDVIYLSQAFHHADKPFHLLNECDRVLKKGGRIILVGEHYFTWLRVIKRILVNLIRNGKWTTNFYELFPPDPVLGDHYYRCSDYYFMFRSMGYSIAHYSVSGDEVIYVADKLD
ncbi:MAG: class I SAM-dependent methyltransferase [Candidatus Omnitrophota bacterium]